MLQHEAFVHVATALNGRAQPRLTSLAFSAFVGRINLELIELERFVELEEEEEE